MASPPGHDESLSAAGAGPTVTIDEAEHIVARHFGVRARAERLTGERDENFRMRTQHGPEFVLKVARAAESAIVWELPTAALLYLERTDPALPVPRVRHSDDGSTQIRFKDQSGAIRMAVLYTYLAGTPLMAAARSLQQRTACGYLLARLAQALRGFDHPAGRRTLIWDLRRLPSLLALLPQIPELPQRTFLADFLARFESSIVPRLDAARRQVVHNDFTARNIIVDSQQQSRVTGIIDFGDAVHTALAADVAIGVIGQLATAAAADESIDEFVSAYCEIEPLTAEELGLLDWLIAGRIVQNAVLVSWHRARCPEGEHFHAFDAEFFAWRIDLAQRLIATGRTRMVNLSMQQS